MNVVPVILALLLAGMTATQSTSADDPSGKSAAGVRQRTPAAATVLGCYTRFQSSVWSSNIHGVYVTNMGQRALVAGTRVAWTVTMARSCTDEEASPSLNVGEYRLTTPLAPGDAVKVAEAAAGTTGKRSYRIAGCEARIIRENSAAQRP